MDIKTPSPVMTQIATFEIMKAAGCLVIREPDIDPDDRKEA